MANEEHTPSRPAVAGASPEQKSLPGVPIERSELLSRQERESDLSELLRDIRSELNQAHAFAVTVCYALEAISVDGGEEAGNTLRAGHAIIWDQIQRLEWIVEHGRIVGDKVSVPKWVPA
jgi:hypothetical protein